MLGTGKDSVFACTSSNKCGVGDILERERTELSVAWVQSKVKPKGRGPTLEETRPDHATRSSLAIARLPLGHDRTKRGRDYLV